MLKTAISSLSSTLLSTAKETVKSYMPTTETVVSGAFNQIAQNGIANLSYRSPILATLAQSVMQNFQLELIKKKKMQSYVQSKEADWLRPQVKAKMGDKASDAKIEQEMIKILSKMSTAIDKDGVEATKKSGVFKEYEQYFDEFKKSTQESAKQEATQGNATGVAATGDTAHDSETLNRIEGNTQRTVNVLEVLASHNNTTGGGTPGTGTGTGGSFIDPMTGMPSVTAAVGSIGGSFLGKIFDDKTISKFADKTKELFGLGDSADAKEKKPATVVKEKNVSDVLNETSTTINTNHDKETVVTAPDTKTVAPIAPDNTSEASKEITTENNDHYEKLQRVSEESLTELKKIAAATAKEGTPAEKSKDVTEKSKDKPEKESLIDKSLNKTKDKIGSNTQARIPKGQPGAGRFASKALQAGKESASYAKKATSGFGAIGPATNLASKALGATGTGAAAASGAAAGGGMGIAGKVALGALAVGAAGVAGAVVGSKVVAPLIDKGISAATGKENSLGGWIYDKMHPEENAAKEPEKAASKQPKADEKPSGPKWNSAVSGYKDGATPVSHLEQQYPGAEKKFIELSKKSKPKSDSLESIKLHEDGLKLQAIASLKESGESKVDAKKSDTPSKLEAAKSPAPNQIASLTEAKNQQDISKASSTPQTIVLNNGGGGSAPAPAQPSPAPTGTTSIRNQDSTFERVQMQDFWHRTK